MIGVFCWAVCGSCALPSCILTTLSIVYKNAFWVAAWRWLYKEAETCRWYDLLIIFYIIKVVLDCKHIYLINYWKHNGEASPENHSRCRLVYGDHKTRALQGWITNWMSFKFHNPDSRLQQDCHRTRRKFDCPDYWVITWSPQTGGHLSSGPIATGFIVWGFMQEVSTNTRSTHGTNWNNI